MRFFNSQASFFRILVSQEYLLWQHKSSWKVFYLRSQVASILQLDFVLLPEAFYTIDNYFLGINNDKSPPNLQWGKILVLFNNLSNIIRSYFLQAKIPNFSDICCHLRNLSKKTFRYRVACCLFHLFSNKKKKIEIL